MTVGTRFNRSASRAGYVLLTLIACTVSCTPPAYLNDTASLGGSTPGGRGSINLQFINNTPYRAIFTYGTYDAQNDLFPPQFKQFAVDPSPTNRLEGNSTSLEITFTVGRTVSLGGNRLIELINDDKLGGDLNQAALQPGIAFSSSPLDSPDADQPTGGRTGPNDALIGVDYQHDSLIVYTFSVDESQPSGFLISRVVVLP